MTEQGNIEVEKRKIIIRGSKKNKWKVLWKRFRKNPWSTFSSLDWPNVRMKWPLSFRFPLHKRYVMLSFIVFVGLMGIALATRWLINNPARKGSSEAKGNQIIAKKDSLDFKYPDLIPNGVSIDQMKYSVKVIEENIPILEFFSNQKLDTNKLVRLDAIAKKHNVETFEKAHELYEFRHIHQPDSSFGAFYIYEMRSDSFAIISLKPQVEVVISGLPITSKINSVSGLVKSHFFWETFLDNGADGRLFPKILDVMKWQIDFYHVSLNDQYKIVYEEQWYNGKLVGIGDILAIYFKNQDKEYYIFKYNNDGKIGYFTFDGDPTQLKFLKSPVANNIINSAYNPRRLHPVLNKIRPHWGTDYAANLNDPVFAIGEGTIIAARYTKGNGNYVKIKHDDTYQSQYLHLNKFVKNMKPGRKVQQGEIIGYAGETGLATGVHVCFRFWKNGTQVDHTKEEVFQADYEMARVRNVERFFVFRDSMRQELDDVRLSF